MKKLLLLVVSVIASLGMNAQSFDASKWMEQLVTSNPNIRLSQMSIPYSHDAGTYAAKTWWWCDQTHDEKYLFARGVRAFDMRIAYDHTNSLKKVDGSWMKVGHMRHGDAALLINNLNDFQTEMSHLPDKSQIGNECLFLFVRYEGSVSDATQRDAFKNFMYFVCRKYGSDKSLYASFRPGITMKELQGKIVIFVASTAMAKAGYNNIPINIHCGSDANHIFGLYGSANTAKVIRQDEYDASNITKKVNYIESAFQQYWNSTNEKNASNIFLLNQFNAWDKSCGGVSFAGDYYTTKIVWKYKKVWKLRIYYPTTEKVYYNGVNHQIYDYLKKTSRALGFCAMDFSCTDSYYSRSTYGTNLVSEIVRHNFLVSASSCPAQTAASRAKAGASPDMSDIEGLEGAVTSTNDEATPVNTVTEDNTATQAEYYDLEGHRLDAPRKGVNIVKYSDGTTKKVFK